jgi:hypothetical protein
MNRMYQVIVIGGVALVGPVCGGTVTVANQGTTTGGQGGFPDETGAPAMTTSGGGFPQEGFMPPSSSSGFPTEGPASSSSSGFPNETDGVGGAPPLMDGGSDATPFDAPSDAPTCFPPEETAFQCPDGSVPPPPPSDGGP